MLIQIGAAILSNTRAISFHLVLFSYGFSVLSTLVRLEADVGFEVTDWRL